VIIKRRKVCQLTGNKFVDSDQKHLYVIDKTKSVVTKDNILVTTKTVQESLDKFFVECKLDIKSLKKLFKTLSEQ